MGGRNIEIFSPPRRIFNGNTSSTAYETKRKVKFQHVVVCCCVAMKKKIRGKKYAHAAGSHFQPGVDALQIPCRFSFSNNARIGTNS